MNIFNETESYSSKPLFLSLVIAWNHKKNDVNSSLSLLLINNINWCWVYGLGLAYQFKLN